MEAKRDLKASICEEQGFFFLHSLVHQHFGSTLMFSFIFVKFTSVVFSELVVLPRLINAAFVFCKCS